MSNVEELTKPETFNFAEAVLDRNYPEIKVPVYLDEKSVQELVDALQERQELEVRVAKMSGKTPVDVAKRLGEIEETITDLSVKLKETEYVVLLKGIAPEDHEKLIQKANETFPIEYTESLNPITGTTSKVPVESEERDDYLVTLIRQAHLVSVTAPNGAVDADFKGDDNIGKVKTTFARLPFIARYKIDKAIEDATIQVDFYRELVDEVF